MVEPFVATRSITVQRSQCGEKYQCPKSTDLYYFIGLGSIVSCTSDTRCIHDVVIVTLTARLAKQGPSMGIYKYDCALFQDGNWKFSQQVSSTQKSELCLETETIVRFQDTKEPDDTKLVTYPNTLRIYWPSSQTICLWMRAIDNSDVTNVNVLSTIITEQATRIRGSPYNFSMAFVDNYDVLKVNLDAANSNKVLHIRSYNPYDWILLRTDTNWHLICVTYQLTDSVMQVEGYIDGNLVGQANVQVTLSTQPFYLKSVGLGHPRTTDDTKYRPKDVEIYSFKMFVNDGQPTSDEMEQLYNSYCGAKISFAAHFDEPFKNMKIEGVYPSISIEQSISPVVSTLRVSSVNVNSYKCTAANLFPEPLLVWQVLGTHQGNISIGNGIPGWQVAISQPVLSHTKSVLSASIELSIRVLPASEIQSDVHRLLHRKSLICDIDDYERAYGVQEKHMIERPQIILDLPYGARRVTFGTTSTENGKTVFVCRNDGTNPPPITSIYLGQKLVQVARDGEAEVYLTEKGTGVYTCEVTNGNGDYPKNTSVTILIGELESEEPITWNPNIDENGLATASTVASPTQDPIKTKHQMFVVIALAIINAGLIVVWGLGCFVAKVIHAKIL